MSGEAILMDTEEAFDLILSDYREIRYKMGLICSRFKEISKENKLASFDVVWNVILAAKKITEISESDLKELRNEMSKKEGNRDVE